MNLGIILFVRSRGTVRPLLLIGFTAVAILFVGKARIELPLGSGASIPYATVLPVLGALAVTDALPSRASLLEALASRRMGVMRAAHALAFTLMAAVTILASSPTLVGELGRISIARNLALLSGIGMIASTVFPPGLSWLPLLSLTGTILALAGGDGSRSQPWALLLRPDSDGVALLISTVVAITGIGLLLVRAPRGVSGDDRT